MDRVYRAAMIAGLLTGAITTSAIACSGTTAYPAVAKAFEQSTLNALKKAELMRKFNGGYATHKQGHAENSSAKMMEALAILSAVKAEITK